ncbi:unnamed protein product [Brassica oleracea var. botrytis]|uniref:(rape) hypothetical protein n=1 Tax=Brassica napus TaxID=3708 RepID=A0A816IHB5_BRANA|nr:unnamed protein product [Brassica napus]
MSPSSVLCQTQACHQRGYFVLILVCLVQILAIESLSHLFLRVHIAQFQSCSHSAYEPSFVFFNGKLSQLGLQCLESFISSPFIAEASIGTLHGANLGVLHTQGSL